MTLLVINRRRILPQLAQWFPDSRAELTVVTSASALAGAEPAAFAGQFGHLEVVDDYEHPDTELRILQLCRERRAGAVLTTGERDLVRAARVRARLGLPGQCEASALAYSNKYVMKETARAAGIPVAPMRRVSDRGELSRFAEEHGFPVVVKQLSGGSCTGMRVLADHRQLVEFARNTWPSPGGPTFLAEAWIGGRLFHVNGLMDNGTIVHSWPSVYYNTQWQTAREGRPDVSGMLPEGHPLFAPLRRRTAEVVAALPHAPGLHPVHAEFFVDPDGSPVLCEIACRAGGSGIVEVYERAFGVNLYEAGLKGQAGRAAEVAAPGLRQRLGYSWMPWREGVLRRLPDHCPLPGVLRYSTTGVPGRHYGPPVVSSANIAQAVFTISGDDVLSELRPFDEWWQEASQWTPAAGPGTAAPAPPQV